MNLSEIRIPNVRHSDQGLPSGRADCSRIVSLLIGAYNERLSGRMSLQLDSLCKFELTFAEGCIVSLRSEEIEKVYWQLLGAHLPDEQLGFAREHSESRGLSALVALEVLTLLPAEILQLVQQQAVTLEMSRLCQLEHEKPARLLYEIESTPADEIHLSYAIEPLALLSECILHSIDLVRLRAWLQRAAGQLVSISGRLVTPSYQSSQNVKKVAVALRRQPESYHSLLQRALLPDDELVAVLGALIATESASPLELAPSDGAVGTPPPVTQRSTGQSTVPAHARMAIHGRTVRGATSSNQPSRVGSRPPSVGSASPPLGSSSSPPRVSLNPASSRAPTMRIRKEPSQSPGHSDKARPSAASSGVHRLDRGVKSEPASGSPSSAHGKSPASRGLGAPEREPAAEANAFKAWMAAEAESQHRPKALAFVKKAALHYPNNPSILFYLGSVHLLSGNLFDAEIILGRVLELDPEHSEAARELRWLKNSEPSKDRSSPRGRFSGG